MNKIEQILDKLNKFENNTKYLIKNMNKNKLKNKILFKLNKNLVK